jgi:hypothetical protein
MLLTILFRYVAVLAAVKRIPNVAKKAIRAMQPTGMFGRGNLSADNRSMRNGSALRERFGGVTLS